MQKAAKLLGECRWETCARKGCPAPVLPTGSPNLGGPATTQTGLVFIGATLDDYFRAFDTRNGREVWKARLPTSARATPLVFTTPSGRHMVAIAAGGHDHRLSRIDTKMVVFALTK